MALPILHSYGSLPRFHQKCRACQPRRAGKRRRADCRASSEGNETSLEAMTTEQACELLGVSPTAGFEEVLRAKTRLLEQSSGPSSTQVEAAYDTVLMQSMRRRIQGEVDTKIKFADVKKSRPAPIQQSSISLPVRYEPVDQQTLIKHSAFLGALALWCLLQGTSQTPDMQQDASGLPLGLALGVSLYFSKERRLSTGKIFGLCLGGAVAGALLGTALQAWLRVDIVPVAGLSSPATLISETVILGLWAGCTLFA